MNRNDILEAMFEVIKDSTEWGVSCEDGSYGQYVDGVVAMTEAMLDKAKIVERCKKLEDINKKVLEAAKEYSDEFEHIEANGIEINGRISTISDELTPLHITKAYNELLEEYPHSGRA